MVRQFEVYIATLDPTIGAEIQKARPCVVISPDDINQYLHTVIVAPMSSTQRNYPYRVNLTFNGRNGQILLDQIRTIDKRRLRKKLGKITETSAIAISDALVEMFTF